MKPHANLKFAFEGEEEIGSPHLKEDTARQHGASAGRPVDHL